MPLLESPCDFCQSEENCSKCKTCGKNVASDLCLYENGVFHPIVVENVESLVRIQQLKDEQRLLLAQIKQLEESNAQREMKYLLAT